MMSIFDLFSVAIGPSSSHTVGPMRASGLFLEEIRKRNYWKSLVEVRVELYGSLALTGKGHGTDRAVILGLEGEAPEKVDTGSIEERLESIQKMGYLLLSGEKKIAFTNERHIIFHKDKFLPRHSNGMRFTALDEKNKILFVKVYYSVGGGFVVDENMKTVTKLQSRDIHPPYSFRSSKELLDLCHRESLSICDIMWKNEQTWRSKEEICKGISGIWQVMKDSIKRGSCTEGFLPGGLKVERRAPKIFRLLSAKEKNVLDDPSELFDWISFFALAVNEENAAGGRIVTAPTNGSAGIIPAVLHYHQRFVKDVNLEGIFTFFLVSGAIGILYLKGASISAAEVGCQGEVGVACSMAAGALAAVMGGTNEQIENAAEIGMEHNLGLTCDPVGGLVQIPCIERNTMGAIKAINAARLAIKGDGRHRVSLDEVIATMKQTGKDMNLIYKETSKGGLAVNVVEC